jgi:hypothetical protein
MRPDLAAAAAEMLAQADTATPGEAAHAWRHAAQAVRLFGEPVRALQQLRQHAAFWKDTAPDKAAAYRAAAAILTRHTGQSLAPVVVLDRSPHQQAFAFS